MKTFYLDEINLDDNSLDFGINFGTTASGRNSWMLNIIQRRLEKLLVNSVHLRFSDINLLVFYNPLMTTLCTRSLPAHE